MAPAWDDARHLLAVRLDTLGDVLMTTPALRALKTDAARRLTLLTSSAGADVASLVPEVDDVIVYDAPWMKAAPPRLDPHDDHAMIDRLRRSRFDATAIFTVYSQSPLPAALLCHLARVPRRLAHCHENPYQLLTDWVPDPEPDRLLRHEVQRHLDLVATVGFVAADPRLSLRVPAEAWRHARRRLADIGAGPRWLLVHPGASAASRRYPHFADVARRLSDRGFTIVFTGGAAEAPLVHGIQQAMGAPSRSLAGQLTLAELAAVIAAAPLLVSNNTGPVHVAAAVGTPVVDLYALTNPQHTPWGVPHRVLSHDVPCRYCYKSVCPEGHGDCLRRVAPEAVVRAVLELLHETGGRRAGLADVPAAAPR